MRSAPIRGLAATVVTLTLASALALSLSAPQTARAQADPSPSSWVGTGADPYWDSAANWTAGTAPSGALGGLAFPDNGATCLNSNCVFSVDDIQGLELGTLAIDAGQNYVIVPLSASNSLSLSGGIDFQGALPQTSAPLTTNLEVAVTLAAKQTWTLDGVLDTPSRLRVGSVTGMTFPLTLNFANGTVLTAAALNTGPLTVTGNGTVVLAQPLPGSLGPAVPPPAPILGSQGVTLARGASITFKPTGTLSGPITVARGSNSTIQIGSGTTPDATVTVSGGVTLRGDTQIGFSIDAKAAQGKPRAGVDFSKLTAMGTVNLNSAALQLSQGFVEGSTQCAPLKGGQTYTVISSYGVVNGTFAGIANDQAVSIGDCDWPNTPSPYAVLVRYQHSSVTATVIGGAQTKSLVAQTVTETAVLSNRGYTESYDAPTAGTLTLNWTATVHGKRVAVASATNVANRVGPRQIVIKPTAAGTKLLQGSGQLTIMASATLTSSAGTVTKASKRITLN